MKEELQEPEIFRAILDSLRLGVYLVDLERNIVFWNRGAEEISGYLRHEVIGRSCRQNILLNCTGRSCVLCGSSCPLAGSIQDGKTHEALVYIRHKAGFPIPVQVRVEPIRGPRGAVIGAVESFDERTSMADTEVRQSSLEAHGCMDTVTGVANHAFTRSHLRDNLGAFAEYHLPFGVLHIAVLELDRMRETHGRAAAESMLHVAAQTVLHTAGADNFVGRWAEHEFLEILPNCNGKELEEAAANIRTMAAGSGIHWWDDRLSLTVAVGASLVQPGDTLESLLERAAQASVSGDGAAGA